MKKFQKTEPKITASPITASKKTPKKDLIQLLPTILKILPNFNLGEIFHSQQQPKSENFQTDFMHGQNVKAFLHSTQIHMQKVQEIKEKNKNNQ